MVKANLELLVSFKKLRTATRQEEKHLHSIAEEHVEI